MGWLSSSKKPGATANIEATLERIVSNAAADNQFALYKLVNYRRGGTIIDAHSNLLGGGGGGGGDEHNLLETLCTKELTKYMYHGGHGRTITTAECLNWRNRHTRQVAIQMAARPSSESNLSQPNNNRTMQDGAGAAFGGGGGSSNGSYAGYASGTVAPYEAPEDHPACWMLDKRGALGENPLHVLVICDTSTHTSIAKVLLRHFPKLALDIMEGGEYYGLSPLHLAVAYNNNELVEAFVVAGANVNERAVGRFFMPTDQQIKINKNTDYTGLSYLGEYPLSWAACSENEAIYNYLLDNGADPNLQDFFGNMILHMVVISNKLGMYGYALRHPKKPANSELLNKAGLTPLALACTLGRNKIFREMLELSAVEFWRFCNVTCSAYPLIALDSIRPDGGTNWKSALMIILNGETDEHLDMLEGGVVQRVLEDKWKTFARMQFLKRLAVLVSYLMVISIAVYLRPPFSDDLTWEMDAKIMIRYCAELAALLGCANFVILQQGSEIRSQGLTGFLSNMTRSPAKFVFLLSNICMMLCVPCRVLGLRLIEDTLLIFALPGSWFFLMFFAGAVRLTGPFVTMIYSMIAGDMVRFGIIYLIILLGFSQAFFFLFKTCYVGVLDLDDTNVDMYNTYYGTWMALYHMTLGSYQYGDFSKPKYAGLTLGIFVIFMVMVPILLLNMLIAMMGNTYANVISKSEKEFVKQWAKIVLALERAVPKEKAKEYLNAYAINLGPPPEPGGLQMKGVMAINCKLKTKAQQRKGAFRNWRRMGKKSIKEMRKYNCRGDQLLAKLTQVAASKVVSRRGSFPRILGEELEAELEGDQSQEISTRGGCSTFDEALAQLAFAYDLDLEPPQPPQSQAMIHSKLNNRSPMRSEDKEQYDMSDDQTIISERLITPPPPYQNVRLTSAGRGGRPTMADGDIASVAFMAVHATFQHNRPVVHRTKSITKSESSTNLLSEESFTLAADHPLMSSLAAGNELKPTTMEAEIPSMPGCYSPLSPRRPDAQNGEPAQLLEHRLKSAPPSTSTTKAFTSRPKVVLQPAKLKVMMPPTPSSSTMSTTFRRRKSRCKTRRRGNKSSSVAAAAAASTSAGLHILANRVGAMAPLPTQLVSTIDLSQAETMSNIGSSSSAALAAAEAQAESPSTTTTTTTTVRPMSARSPSSTSMDTSQPNRILPWSTKSLLSMSSLVAWKDNDEDDYRRRSSSQSSCEEPPH